MFVLQLYGIPPLLMTNKTNFICFSCLISSTTSYFVTVDAHAEECFFDKVPIMYYIIPTMLKSAV